MVLEHSLVPRSITLVGDLIELSDRTALVDAAFARLAYASDRTVKRLASVRISKMGTFSMDAFGSLPSGMNLHMPAAATVRGDAKQITDMLHGLKPQAPVVNNNIELTLAIESIRSEDDIESLAGQIANEIAKELPNKLVTE